MEFLLLLWDELDDLTGACRHMASSAAGEISGLSASLATAGSAFGAWLFLSYDHLGAALMARMAALWSAHGTFLHFLG